jgi:predicted esterase
LEPPATDREELQIPGLCETIVYLHGLLRAEIAAVPGGAANVVLGGLSQGCAAALLALLLWEGDALGAGVGMCGWLPFAARLNEQVSVAVNETIENGQHWTGESGVLDDGDSFDPFQREDAEDGLEDQGPGSDPVARSVHWLRDEVQVAKTRPTSTAMAFQDIPLFLAHGVEDDRVSVILGRDASSCLGNLGIEASWREYESLGHWYSGDMLRDIVQFIYTKTNWKK